MQIHTREFLLKLPRATRRLGWEAGIHCVGDAAGELVCDIYEVIHREMPVYGQRWAVEHGILAHGDQSRRLAAMDVAIAAHGLHLFTVGQNMVRRRGSPPGRPWSATRGACEADRRGGPQGQAALPRGKLADLVVLSADPTTGSPRIRDIRLLLTVDAGRVVFEGDGEIR